MTMVIRISEGRRSMIEAPMLIFTNQNKNYPIDGLDDNILGVCYMTRPKDWMDQVLFVKYFAEPGYFNPMFMVVLRWFGWIIVRAII